MNTSNHGYEHNEHETWEDSYEFGLDLLFTLRDLSTRIKLQMIREEKLSERAINCLALDDDFAVREAVLLRYSVSSYVLQVCFSNSYRILSDCSDEIVTKVYSFLKTIMSKYDSMSAEPLSELWCLGDPAINEIIFRRILSQMDALELKHFWNHVEKVPVEKIASCRTILERINKLVCSTKRSSYFADLSLDGRFIPKETESVCDKVF